ncbi:MAG: DUF4412 domain-containing protein [Deltaproteobacteria bacterium]|nr:DUF4412 domain-containing protein [Deltaproteobacteria bacterium]
MKKTAVVFAFLLAALGLGLPARAERLKDVATDYSADGVMDSGGMQMASRIYHSMNKERMEQDMEGVRQTIILRTDKKIAWVLMPEMRMYMEMNYGSLSGKTYNPEDMDYTLVEEGKETVNGIQTTRYKMTARDKNGKKFDGSLWLTPEGIMVKIDAVSKGKKSDERVKMELRNLKIAPLDRALFEVPSGYSKMQGMGGMGTDAPGGGLEEMGK